MENPVINLLLRFYDHYKGTIKIDQKDINFFYDTTSFKINKYLPGSKIKIRKYKKLSRDEADYVFLGAWNFKEEIFNKEKEFIKNGGKFITHVPLPKII